MTQWPVVVGGGLLHYTYLDLALHSATKYPGFLVTAMEQFFIPF